MTDLINRQAAIDALWKLEAELRPSAIDALLDMLKNLPSAQQWIPCSERLPSEKDGQVLATQCGEVRIATYSEFSGTWYVGEMCAVGGEDPIAWMPLPEPYQEGEGK